jgi:Uma2 family endonuclease
MATLNLNPIVTLTRDQFQKLCAANPDVKLERSANGDLIIMAPTGGETGSRNAELIAALVMWNKQSQLGKVFDSSTGFALPQGSDRSPDAAWVTLARWEALTPEERRGFLPLCPDFVIELLSPSDSWSQGQQKMEDYQQNGCRLGWLLDPKGKQAALYRLQQPVAILTAPNQLTGEDVLPGFILDARFLWS